MKLNELRGLDVSVYDIECKNQVDGVNIGWKDYEKMGISVLTIFNFKDGDYHVYFENDLARAVEKLNSSKLVVGFNIIGFDNPLLRTLCPELKKDSDLNVYDIYDQSKRSIATADDRPRGLRLDDHLSATFGILKTAHGAEAPLMFQQGRIAELVSYNIADVRRERMLFEHIWQNGTVTTAAYGTQKVAHPKEML